MKKILTISTLSIVIIVLLTIVSFAKQQLSAEIVSFKVVVNGISKTFENDIVTINNRTYVPLREVAETLDMNVTWNEENQIIDIVSFPSSTNEPDKPLITDSPPITGSPSNTDNQLYLFKEGKLCGYKDKHGNVIIEPQFYVAHEYSEGLAVVSISQWGDGQCGYIDETGTIVIPCIYYNAFGFKNGVATVDIANGDDDPDGIRLHIDKRGNVLSEERHIDLWLDRP